MYRLLTVVAFLGVVTAYDVVLGKGSGKRIYDERLTASPTLWKRTQEVFINATGDDVISRVVITDNRPDKNGDVHVLDGGAGKKNVKVELKSPTIFRGYDFHVEVYAEPEDEYLMEIGTNKSSQDVDVPVVIGEDTDVNTNASVVTKEADKFDDANPTASPSDVTSTTAVKEDEVHRPIETGKDITDDNKNYKTTTTITEGSGYSDLDSKRDPFFSSKTKDTQRKARDIEDLSSFIVLPIQKESVTTKSDKTVPSVDNGTKNVTTIIMHIDEADVTTDTTTTEDITNAETNLNYKQSGHKIMIPVPYNREYVY